MTKMVAKKGAEDRLSLTNNYSTTNNNGNVQSQVIATPGLT